MLARDDLRNHFVVVMSGILDVLNGNSLYILNQRAQ